MNYSFILPVLLLLHYGSSTLHYGSKKTKRFRISKGSSRTHRWTKKCDIPNTHMKKGGHKGGKLCSSGREKLGEKRDFLPSFQYDESQEFGGGNRMMGGRRANSGVGVSAKKSGLFSPSEPMVCFCN